MTESCDLCGQPCPFHCLCPECHKAMCDDCYTRHFEANCRPAMADAGESRENLLRMLEEFLDAYPAATVADVMAEFDLSADEIHALFAELKASIEQGWLLS